MTKFPSRNNFYVSILLAFLSTSSADMSSLHRVLHECSPDTCVDYNSFSELVLDLKTLLSDGPATHRKHHSCLCLADFSPENINTGVDTCGNATEGSTIVVPIDSDLQISCADPNQNCFMGCPDMLFKVEGNLTLKNLSMGGGIVWESDSRIQVGPDGRLIMQDSNIMVTQTNGKGGAISNLGGTVVITNGFLSDCYAAKEGGAIYSEGHLELHDSMILGGRSGVAGGGLFAGPTSTTVLNDVRFNFNEAPEESGDIYLETGASIEGCGEILDQSSTLKTINGEIFAVIEPCGFTSDGAITKAMSGFVFSVLWMLPLFLL